MAVYQFSALSDGQAITFNAAVDRLNFDQTNVAAGDLRLVQEGSNLHVIVKSGTVAGKDIFLNSTALEQIAATNFTFVDGSVARVGDNNVGTAGDAGANALAGGAGRDLLMGLGGNDTLAGGDNNDSLVGGTGNDNLNGSNGNDWLEGNSGNDTLTGSGGQDAFLLRESGAANADLLADFASGWDNIQLDAAAFTAIGAAGRFTASDPRFFAGSAAHDADDRIIYNSATGQILYDADGNGSGAAQLIATLPAGRGVVASDFNVIGTPGSGGGGQVINGTAGNDTLTGGDGNDTINGFAGNDSITGAAGLDSMVGGDGNDTLDGTSPGGVGSNEAGEADTLDGGLGDDTYIVGANDVILADPGGIDTVNAVNTDWTLGAGLENLILHQTAAVEGETGNGNDLNNFIDASGIDHGGVMHGFGGNDTIIAAQHDSTLFGDDGDDLLDGSGDIHGAPVFGGNGNDTLIGSDQMTGGSGADSFVFRAPNADTITDFESGTDKIHLDATFMSALGTTGNFSAGDARFFAAPGASSGHDADDRVIYDTSSGWLYYDLDGNGAAAAQAVAHVMSGGASAVVTAGDIFVDNGSSGGGQAINGTAGNDSLVGGPGNDTLNGFAGNDTLDGQGGADSLVGGTGDDIYEVDNSADVIVEGENEGIDTVHSTVDYELGAFVNNLVLMGAAVSGIGNEIDNILSTTNSGHGVQLDGLGGNDTLLGSFSDDELNGWSGDDFMNGGAGNDVFDTQSRDDGNDTMFGGLGDDRFFASPGDSVNGGDGTDTVFARSSWTLGATEENLTLHTGTDDHDLVGVTAVGNASNNVIDAGLDVVQSTFDGKAGNDTLIGGGDDIDFLFTVSPGAANADVITDFVSSNNSIVLDGAVHANSGPSGAYAAGDARFHAAAGANAGHDADDRVIYNTATGQLWYDADGNGAGVAQLIATLQGAPTLGATNIEIINGGSSGGGQLITGTSGNDNLTGGPGNDTLDGLGGADTMNGLAGDDTYFVTAGDVLSDSGGNDTVIASVSWSLAGSFENLTLTGATNMDGSGNFFANAIVGNSANNILKGRDGHDTLTGGGGADFFDFVTTPSSANSDVITDFTSGIDRLRFEDGVHAGIGATGNWAATDGRFFAAAGATAGHDASDRVVYDTSTGAVYYDADGSGTGAAVLVATLQGAPTLSATDITVI